MARLRKQQRVLHPSFRHFQDIILICLLLVAMSVYFYGLRPAILVLISVVTAVVADFVIIKGREELEYDATDISSIAFAIIFTLMLPASAPYYVVVLGTLVTIVLGKHAFGGSGNYPFHPSAFGYAASAICWFDVVYKYPVPFTNLPLTNIVSVAVFDSPAATLKVGGVPQISFVDLLIGNYIGPMGTACFLILFSALVFLIAKNAISWHIPVLTIAVVSLWAFLFPRIQASRGESVLYEVLTDSLIFTCIFIATDPCSSPTNTKSKIIYGLTLGVITCAFSYYGAVEFSSAFALMLVSPISSLLDRRYSLTRNLRTHLGGDDR